MANSEDRKRQIMDHVKRTTKVIEEKSSVARDQQKQRVMDHVKRTRG